MLFTESQCFPTLSKGTLLEPYIKCMLKDLGIVILVKSYNFSLMNFEYN